MSLVFPFITCEQSLVCFTLPCVIKERNMKKSHLIASCIAVASFVIFACNENKLADGTDYLASHVDTTANPRDDFFQWANGAWLKANPIPASESNWGIGDMVQEEVYNRLKQISEEAAASNAAEGTDQKKIGDFWATGMDSAKADQLGFSPLQKEIDMIRNTKTVADVVQVMSDLEPIGIGLFCSGVYVGQDARNSEKMALHLWQGGLGLPDRDYYFNTDAETKEIRDNYPAHIAKMLVLIGYAEADAKQLSEQVLKFETVLADSSRELEELRDPYANYNKMAVGEVTSKLTPSINWKTIYDQHGLKNVDSVIVGQPEFFKGLELQLKSTDIKVLQAYMHFHLVSSYAKTLSTAIDDENFSFYGVRLRGATEKRARWKRVLDSEEDAMGMVLGKLFVKEYFPEKTKQRYVLLVESIREVYAERIKALDWMSDTTKAKALDKLSKMSKKVGYPDKWKDYSALVVGRNSYCENVMNASCWQFNDMISKYGKPIDRTEWEMTPQTYNAYYNPSNNEIVLPAGIFMIPGLPDSTADDAVIYGYAGASTIGHEITHGFDDEGRNFDAAGNLVSWWTDSDADHFKLRADVMVNQFSAFEPLPGKFINGEATLGENIADYGGILLGWDAFVKTEQYKNGEKIGGYTPAQRYFMGYALGWMMHQREEELARRLLTDVHSPAKWRVNGPFSNCQAFMDAFGVKQGDKMWRDEKDRVSIW